jgi:type III restriction enzyme
LIEIKKASDIENKDVLDKAKAAVEYCKTASEVDLDKKPWKYLLIPHDSVLFNSSVKSLSFTYEFANELSI